jgi:hypothetical protein
MCPSKNAAPISWDRVRERLPSTAQEVLDEIQEAYERSPDDTARAIERVIRSRIAHLRNRFKEASGSDIP